MSFGYYLIKKGKIKKKDLDVALKLNTEKGIRLGVLAIDDGLLTEPQLNIILKRQREISDAGLFGEIAINMNLLSKEQVNVLLEKQKEYDRIINQIMVLSGAISNSEKEKELKLFYNMIVGKEDLEAAQKNKIEKSLKLGALAIKNSLLTEQQLSIILERQREISDAGLFGEIAINMNLLSKEQVNVLLDKQKEYDRIIGQILVLSGAISNSEKEKELKLFYKSVSKKEN
ncbi:hypothetical protein SCALIN_C01_0232 [Candidatus Scalindua japonica]|uniref:Uncharacterized protein n=1 Tax=Candidatus Scalindua japonica TaxID=1284222 RepID=A0A286TTW3_9BACT|nr:hypothetical protein [Candidatus Scalindua japonica]GAX59301.1 hypothetical protein SCALIN_C01_0232 [Candidatus Scalindua japonica]